MPAATGSGGRDSNRHGSGSSPWSCSWASSSATALSTDTIGCGRKASCAAARSQPQLVARRPTRPTTSTRPCLRQMVEDGAAILKVGPALTFAVREALFALEGIEAELADRLPAGRSHLRNALERAMDADPRHWRGHFDVEGEALRRSRTYSLFDRCRYYWAVPEVDAAVRRLVANLRQASIPLALLSQYCPRACAKIRRGELTPDPEAIVHQQISDVLAVYASAVSGS